MSTIDYSEYWSTIDDLAIEAIRITLESCGSCDLTGNIWEMVTDHEWIIYSAYQNFVLLHTDNDYAYDDHEIELNGDWYEIKTTVARSAMVEDVRDRVARVDINDVLEIAYLGIDNCDSFQNTGGYVLGVGHIVRDAIDDALDQFATSGNFDSTGLDLDDLDLDDLDDVIELEMSEEETDVDGLYMYVGVRLKS